MQYIPFSTVTPISIGGDNPTVTKNVIGKMGEFATAITVEGMGARVANNQIDASTRGRGIAVGDAPGAQITDNTILYGGGTTVSGMNITVSPGARVHGNSIRGSGKEWPAMEILYSDDVTLTENQIVSNSLLLHLAGTRKVQVRNNKLEAGGTEAAIRLVNTDGSTITGNGITMTDAKGALLVFESSNNNTISGNRWTGADPLKAGAVRQDEESKNNVVK